MRIFKFGGASVKDAESVKNVVEVLKTVGHENTLLVISAMGKTTNKLEVVVHQYFKNKKLMKEALQDIREYHTQIVHELFSNDSSNIDKALQLLFDELDGFLNWNKSPNYSFVYDQVVSFGELFSTTIISHYLNHIGLTNTWLDVRTCIKTDQSYRDAIVNWEVTQSTIAKKIQPQQLYTTQGFLGSDKNNFTTTLGREGSDYTAAIFAYCLNAHSVTIWKDVPGVLNADPRYFTQTKLLKHIPYEEAIELAFYGASVIHPKTLQPLQRKEIPLHVKSFLNPTQTGTQVSKGELIDPLTPCFIVKKEQHLLSLSSLDFSFIMEDSISAIFAYLHQFKIKVDVIQNSAISFSVCITDKYNKLDELLLSLKAQFKVECYRNVSLYTIRHYTQEALQEISQQKNILLKQENKGTVQLITSN